MELKLEVVTVPVADVDRSLAFYRDQLGFTLDLDVAISEGVRMVQLTPPDSACSIHIGEGLTEAEPGSLKSVYLVAEDIEEARRVIAEKGVDITPVRRFEDGEWKDGAEGGWNAFAFFEDPDGNAWVLQERGREES